MTLPDDGKDYILEGHYVVVGWPDRITVTRHWGSQFPDANTPSGHIILGRAEVQALLPVLANWLKESA